MGVFFPLVLKLSQPSGSNVARMEKIFLYLFTNAAAISWWVFFFFFFLLIIYHSLPLLFVIEEWREHHPLWEEVGILKATDKLHPSYHSHTKHEAAEHTLGGGGRAECHCRVDCPGPWSLEAPGEHFQHSQKRDKYSGPIPRV